MTSKPLKKEKHTPQTLFNKPFALAIGPQRAGTSWLDRYLRMRGDICVPEEVKEIFFFDRHFERGTGFYKSHFQPKPHHELIIEITTTSFDQEEAPQRIFETFGPDIKLLCPLRNPLVRSYSLYLHYMRYGIVNGTLQQACEQNPQILESSHYAKHLKRWFDVFGKDNIKIVFQEDLEKNQDAYIRNICEGLGIKHKSAPKEISDRFNATTYSKSTALASFIQRTADWLREHRLYMIVNAAKSLGLKPLIFGKENPDAQSTTIPEEDRLWLESQLSDEITKLEQRIGKIPQWT